MTTNVATTLEPDALSEVVEGLTQALAEVSVTTMKAQNFHWNVTGMSFGALHELFQEIYEDHFEAQDDIAERIKALEAHAEGRQSVYLQRSKVQESDGKLDARGMVEALKTDEESLSGTLLALADLSEKAGDMITNDFAIGRAQKHEKYAWMLRAHLQG